MPQLGAAGAAIAAAAIGSAVSGVLSARKSGKERAAAKELATINRTEPGFVGFGDELVDPDNQPTFRLGLENAGRQVRFPSMNKSFYGQSDPERKRFNRFRIQ